MALMNRDPIYLKITQRLNRTLDPQLFEDCVADLLRPTWRGLVPIRGGSDSGMDGAIADGQGEPFPLVTTTSDRAIDNLTRNLKKYVEDGGARRQVVFATSQNLSPQRKKNLLARARERGFTLLQIHDQADIANRLYHSPKWCKELLGLTGDPAPLSRIPKSERIFLNLPLIGRDTDIVWLRQLTGDKILVGQPGTGKTFLLRQLADSSEALFVNSSDRGEIAEGIREQKPSTLIVDDAQLHLDLLLNLKQIREEIGARFSIIATCWPSDEHILAPVLNISSIQIHSLELLPRDSIVQVIKATGIGGSNGLINELVNQAEGRPGLAVTLAHLCLQGDVQQVVQGDALADSLLKNVGIRGAGILAAFAIGGEAGMELGIVAEELNIPPLEIKEYVTLLASSGTIMEVREKQLAIRPPALRQAVVLRVFFHGPAPLDCSGLIDRAPSLEQVGLTLIGANRRHARVPKELIVQVLDRSTSVGVWQDYAWLGHDESLWVLNNRPGILTVIALPLLFHAPEDAIPLLLEQAIGDNRLLDASPDHPLRLIEDWINTAYPGTGESVRRRQILFTATSKWLADGKNVGVGLIALTHSFSPGYVFSESDPGEGKYVQIHSGFLSHDELAALQGQWVRVRELLKNIQIDDTEPLHQLVRRYAYPSVHEHLLPEEIRELMESFAKQMLRDVVTLFSQRMDVSYWARPMATHLNLEINLPIDREFEILYPIRDHRDWQEQESSQRLRIEQLAIDWSQLGPEVVSHRLAYMQKLAERIKNQWEQGPFHLCQQIADKVSSPLSWARALQQTTDNGALVLPFLEQAALLQESGWIEFAQQCLLTPKMRGATIHTALRLVTPPQLLLDLTLANLSGYGDAIKFSVVRKEIPEETVRQILRHADPTIASAAAQGEWMSDPQGAIRESILADWRDAIIRSSDDGFWLRQILICDPRLAYDWLERHIADDNLQFSMPNCAAGGAIAVLDNASRIRLLHQVGDSPRSDDAIAGLVDDRPEVYEVLLLNQRLKRFHLIPLGGGMAGNWPEKAKLALDHGYNVEQVADAAQGYPYFSIWTGNESDRWSEWSGRYNKLLEDSDPRIRRVGELGNAYLAEKRRRALERERKDSIYGRQD